MRLSLVAALSENRVIGRDNRVPWHLPEDLRRFKALTIGHWVIMGRRTFESIGLPLRERTTIVLTTRDDFHAEGVLVARSLDEAIAMAGDQEEIFILGGEAVYREALPRADRMYLTIVHANVEGDTHYPEFDESQWSAIDEERHEADDRHAYAFTFRTYARK
jgi:dihydrofolate reductase